MDNRLNPATPMRDDPILRKSAALGVGIFCTLLAGTLFAGEPTPAPETTPEPEASATLPKPEEMLPETGPELSAKQDWTADSLLDQVLRRLPQTPLLVSGRLIVRKRHGVVLQETPFAMSLQWGATPATAIYGLLNAAGEVEERLTVQQTGAGLRECSYATGKPLTPAPAPSLFTSVRDSDLCWEDLTLSFLWWRGGSMLGTEEVLGHPCHVVEIPAPATLQAPAAAPASKPYTKVILWVDQRLFVVLKAEAYGEGNQLLRALWIRSVRRVNDQWMVKDMEIQSYPVRHRTRLTVDDLQIETPAPQAPTGKDPSP